ncbi:uncharacterized protein LOC128324144 isoform X3 [Hemicordylus capensis]|uniref:uncharacterized protein LOC128324144 isoform X3 n=1 Tax=Hemicordylus capensis TaxID=884348 RepID=UPI0023043741|nr:uncharacterized protein LOC128324144 isoform X3 [Hemicordylus capensis]
MVLRWLPFMVLVGEDLSEHVLASFCIFNSTHRRKEGRKEGRKEVPPKMMSIRDEELSALETSEDNDVEFQEQQQPKNKTPGGSNVEGQPPYKKPRRVRLEPEHEPGVHDEQALNLHANEFLASMAQATEYMQTLIRDKADAVERMTEAEQHREQATCII